ncbi:hypothetical protein [Algibacter pacificus]|uniref:hypothetical protein n=1 Tax=Algibacter pacificus TaxID=2599389 RepID=UPI0011C8BC3C|nr:hypothetical protein [Algibacter pacificus]
MKKVVIITGVLILLTSLYYNFRHTFKKENVNKNEAKNTYLTNNLFVNYKYSDLKTKDIFLENEQDAKVKLSSLVKDNNTLVFRFTELNCNLCYDAVFKVLEKFKNEKILIISSFKTKRDFHLFKEDLNLGNKINIYNNSSFDFNKNLDNFHVPYFFILNQSMRLSNIFMPEKKDPNTIVKYIDLCLSKKE